MTPGFARSDRLLRLAAPPLIALGLCAFAWVLWQMEPSPLTPAAIAIIVLHAYVVSELSRTLYGWLERRIGWQAGASRRLLVQLGCGVLIAIGYALAVYVPLKLWLIGGGERDAIGLLHLSLIGLSALSVALVLGLSHFAVRFLQQWQAAARDAEQHRREALRAELDALRLQVNPHFLFNSLNVVYGLIPEDAARAQSLLLSLADVFRHASRHASSERVRLAEELEFVDAYVALLRARHGEAIDVRIERRGDEDRQWLPPMALQALIENAIKHNTIDHADPLVIDIRREDDALLVGNAVRPRTSAAVASGTGLAGIRRRYALLASRTIEVTGTFERFTVRLPLLPSSNQVDPAAASLPPACAR